MNRLSLGKPYTGIIDAPTENIRKVGWHVTAAFSDFRERYKQ